jgi:L-alanine-DL-glutamate epimerase-like enolase superfamily enzyme
MKITAVQAIPLAIPLKPIEPRSSWAAGVRRQIVVRVLTDEGVVGLGEAFAYGAPLGVCNVIDEHLGPLLLDQDPRRIEALVDRMHRSTMIFGRRGLAMFAISGIEIALWDLLGRYRGAPVHELLGGAVRPRLPAYASLMRYDSPEEVAAACRQHVAQGFRMLKLHQTDVASVRAARETVGRAADLMLDVNCPWSPAEAIAMARSLEPFQLFWLEEPVWPPEDYAGVARVRRAVQTPIALGENESTVFGFREIVERGAADILQPSVTKVGGISELRKIAALAQAANLPLAPHSFYFGPGLAAALHLAATLSGPMPVELPTGEQETPILTQPIVARDGWVDVPTGPGLGVEFNEEAFRRHAYTAGGAEPLLLHRPGGPGADA